MDKLVTHEVYRTFRYHEEYLSALAADSVGIVASAASDIALIVSAAGLVVDVSYRDRVLKGWGLEDWVGRSWAETVTAESRDKIAALLQESLRAPCTRSRQVNHPAIANRDLPVGYRLVALPDRHAMLALGDDLRPMAEMQQRLMRAQIEMEKDYRKIRDIESRYRVLFHLASEPLLVVESQSLKIIDANDGATRLFERAARKLVGTSAATIFARPDQAAAIESLNALGARNRRDAFTARLAASDAPIEVRVTPFREFGKTSLLVALSPPQPSGARQPTEATANLLSLVEHLPEGIVLVNGDGVIVDANPAFLDLVRVVSLDRIEDKALDNWLGGSSVDLQVLMANLREHGTVRRFSSMVRDELGGVETVEVSAAKIPGQGEPLFGFAIRESARSEASAGINGGHAASASQFTDLVGRVPLKDLVRDTADIIEKLCIEAALRLTDNNRASAADMLGLSRQSLYIKLKRYAISDGDPAADA